MNFISALTRYLNQVIGVDLPVSQPWSCRLQSYTLHSSSLTSNYLLISMTFERFYSIIRPHKAALFNTVKKAKIIILCIFMGCFFNSIPFLFLGANIGTKCIPIKNASDKLLHELYYWIQEILIFIFPFISLLTMNSVIINTLKTDQSKIFWNLLIKFKVKVKL